MRFQEDSHGWLWCVASEESVRWAKERTRENGDEAARDGRSSYFEHPLKWVGALGELGFSVALRERGVEFEWFGRYDPRPDFIVYGVEVAMKTRASQRPFQPPFAAVVPDQYADKCREAEMLLFANVEMPQVRLVIYGAIPGRDYFERAVLRKKGEPIGPATVARNDVWQLKAEGIPSPLRWLESVRRTP